MKYLATLLAIALCSASYGQNIDRYISRLAQPDSLGKGRVIVVEYGDAAAAVDKLSAGAPTQGVKVYRINIFSDNKQNAGNRAAEAIGRFRGMFPGIAAYMEYESPDWKVSVGNCTTEDEAIVLMGRVASVFPNPFIFQPKDRVAITKLWE